jgi:hypothetical protein
VGNGQRQQYGLDYIETFTPITNITTIHIVLTIAAHHDWEIHQVDIKSAYLNAALKDTIYMRALPGYLKTEDFGKVLLLLRSLYGLKQAGFEELEKFFLDYGFTCSQVQHLRSRGAHWAFRSQSRMRLTQTNHCLSQKAYVETILERFRLQDAKTTPILMNAGAILSMDQLPSTSDETNEMGDIPYQRGIGLLMYAATSTHPDITFPIAILSQFIWNPGQIHWEAVKDVICYLKATADVTLTLGGSDKGLEAYADADWASQPHRHSMSGYTVLLHSSPVAWSTQKQTIIALSTAEAEYIALTVVMREILYLQALIAELYEPIIPPIPVYCDNCKGNLTDSRRKLHLSLAKGNPK